MDEQLEYNELFELLEKNYLKYNRRDFIELDPISIPHLFTNKQDIEISGLLTATLSWGQRKTIISNATTLMRLMDFNPHQFILHHTTNDLKSLATFKHRTFNGIDALQFIAALQSFYKKFSSLESYFVQKLESNRDMTNALSSFKTDFVAAMSLKRSAKHLGNPNSNSTAKRMCMFLRWMVRKDSQGVDLGIWQQVSPALLYLPLDVHTSRVGRRLGILQRVQNDWKAVEEITNALKKFDSNDPIKYDFALFGLGVGGVL